LLEAMRRWADDEMRSINAQVEWALRRALRERGRALPDDSDDPDADDSVF